jgi:hypothetical protein
LSFTTSKHFLFQTASKDAFGKISLVILGFSAFSKLMKFIAAAIPDAEEAT